MFQWKEIKALSLEHITTRWKCSSDKTKEWKDISMLLKGTSTCWMDKQHICFHEDYADFKWAFIFDLSLSGSDLSDSYLSWKLISVWCFSESCNTCQLFLIFLSFFLGETDPLVAAKGSSYIENTASVSFCHW